MDNRNRDWTKEEFLWFAKMCLNNVKVSLNYARFSKNYKQESAEFVKRQIDRFDPVLGELVQKNTTAEINLRDYLDNKLKDVK